MLPVKVASLEDAGLLLRTTFSRHPVDLECEWLYLHLMLFLTHSPLNSTFIITLHVIQGKSDLCLLP